MTELKVLIPGIVIIAIGNYLTSIDLGFYMYKYFVLLHVPLIFWSLVIYASNYFVSRTKPNFGGLVITTGLIMKMISAAVIFYLLHTRFGLSKGQIINFMLIYFMYTFLLVYSLSMALNKNMTKIT